MLRNSSAGLGDNATTAVPFHKGFTGPHRDRLSERAFVFQNHAKPGWCTDRKGNNPRMKPCTDFLDPVVPDRDNPHNLPSGPLTRECLQTMEQTTRFANHASKVAVFLESTPAGGPVTTSHPFKQVPFLTHTHLVQADRDIFSYLHKKHALQTRTNRNPQNFRPSQKRTTLLTKTRQSATGSSSSQVSCFKASLERPWFKVKNPHHLLQILREYIHVDFDYIIKHCSHAAFLNLPHQERLIFLERQKRWHYSTVAMRSTFPPTTTSWPSTTTTPTTSFSQPTHCVGRTTSSPLSTRSAGVAIPSATTSPSQPQSSPGTYSKPVDGRIATQGSLIAPATSWNPRLGRSSTFRDPTTAQLPGPSPRCQQSHQVTPNLAFFLQKSHQNVSCVSPLDIASAIHIGLILCNLSKLIRLPWTVTWSDFFVNDPNFAVALRFAMGQIDSTLDRYERRIYAFAKYLANPPLQILPDATADTFHQAFLDHPEIIVKHMINYLKRASLRDCQPTTVWNNYKNELSHYTRGIIGRSLQELAEQYGCWNPHDIAAWKKLNFCDTITRSLLSLPHFLFKLRVLAVTLGPRACLEETAAALLCLRPKELVNLTEDLIVFVSNPQ